MSILRFPQDIPGCQFQNGEMSIGGLGWEWKTSLDTLTLIGIAARKAVVVTNLSGMAVKPSASAMAEHYRECLDGLDDLDEVWCKPYPEGKVESDGNSETWWPELLPTQPTHNVWMGGRSFGVLPLDDEGKPCKLSDNCALVTRAEWVAGDPPRYSLRDKALHCNGEAVSKKWELTRCTGAVCG